MVNVQCAGGEPIFVSISLTKSSSCFAVAGSFVAAAMCAILIATSSSMIGLVMYALKGVAVRLEALAAQHAAATSVTAHFVGCNRP